MRCRRARRFIAVLCLSGLFFACRSAGAAGVQEDFRAATAKVLPAVVKIDVVEVAKEQAPNSDSRPFFDYFFENPDGQKPDRPYQQESLGSGIIVRRTGDSVFVVTNAHVIADAQDIKVTLDDGREFAAALVGKDERKDVALVLFDAGGQAIPVAQIGDSSRLRVGDWVLAMGTPYGFQSSVTAGIVSALHRRGGPAGNINDFIQTDAAINKGNSGGALVDIDGRVVGINTWITSQTGDSVGLGFAIPINNVRQAISDFIEVGRIRYGWLGVNVNSLDREMAQSLGLASEKGALVSSVYQGSPADLAGLLPGDVVIAMDGRAIPDGDELVQVVGELAAGHVLGIEVRRNGAPLRLRADVGERLADAELSRQTPALWPGVTLYPMTDKVRKELELDEAPSGLIVRQVVPQGSAQLSGLKSRDVVVKVAGTPVASLAEFYRALASQERSRPIAVTIFRDGKETDIVLNTDKEGLGQP